MGLKIEVNISNEIRFTCHFCGNKNIRQVKPVKEVKEATCRRCGKTMKIIEAGKALSGPPLQYFDTDLVKLFSHEWTCGLCGRSFVDTSTGSPIEALVCSNCQDHVYTHSEGDTWAEEEPEKAQTFLEKIRERLSSLRGCTSVNQHTVIINPDIEKRR